MFDEPTLTQLFPFPAIRPLQMDALKRIAASEHGCVLEMPTGEGKTAIGIAALRAARAKHPGPLFYVTPTLTQAEQVVLQFPDDTQQVFGRASHPCLFYSDLGQHEVTAAQSPCYLINCPHRVNQETGLTQDPTVEPCPYYIEKFAAKSAVAGDRKILVCTTAYFLLNRLLVNGWKDMEPALVVVDEAHGIANQARRLFEHTVSDRFLDRAARIVEQFAADQAQVIGRFAREFRAMVMRKPAAVPHLLKEEEVARLAEHLDSFRSSEIESGVREAVRNGDIDPAADRSVLETIATLTRTMPRLIRQLKLAGAAEGRGPLTYVVASYQAEDESATDDQALRASPYKFSVRSYFVAPLIQKAIGARAVLMSATIGNAEAFSFETGSKMPVHSFASTFAASNCRVFMPKDTPSLAANVRSRNDLKHSLRWIAQSAKTFAAQGKRSLVVVVSDDERLKFMAAAERCGLNALSYGNGVVARDMAEAFKSGRGDVLVGTVAHYAEGIDLPGGIAPIIFMLRPDFPRPDDPQVQFEERRFNKGRCWALWTWRVMQRAVQVRGRNIRAAEDVGVCIFVSQQFRRFLFAGLPEWLKPAYHGDLSKEQVVAHTQALLDRQ